MGEAGCEGVFMCLLGRFLGCCVAVGTMWVIFKLACRCFHYGVVSRVFKVGGGGISGSTGDAYGRNTGSCLGVSGGSVHRWGDLLLEVDGVFLAGVFLLIWV